MYKVTLLSYSPDPQKMVAAAAKLCYSPAGIEDIRANLTDESTAKFVDMLAQIGHESPIEHVSFSFGLEGVSRAFLAQITRHRLASYSVQSQRYVQEDQFEYIIPPAIEEDEQAKAAFIKAMELEQKVYDELTGLLKSKHEKTLAAEGADPQTAAQKAEKMAIEDARFVLPNACATKMIVTMNARSLYNFLRHRCCNRAQWEIRRVADDMLRLLLEVAPDLFRTAGPPCVYGACPEGKMSCGKAAQMREKYTKLREEAR